MKTKNDYNEENYNECIDAIEDLLWACNIYDIKLSVDEDGEIVAQDNDYTWRGSDVFYLLFGDIIEIDDNDQIVDGYGIDHILVDNVLKYKKLFF